MAGAGYGSVDDDGSWGFKATADGKVILGNTADDVLQITGSVNVNDNIFFLNNGRVGINTSAPDYKLGVAGNVGINEYIYHNGDDDTFIRFQPDEINIKAGDTNFISIAGTASDQHKIVFNDGSKDADFIVRSPDASKAIYLNAANEVLHINHDDSAFQTKIHSTNGNAFQVDNSGVTINEGGYPANDFRVESNSNANILFVNSGTDRIGIGTNDPDVLLDVDGDTAVRGQFARGTAAVNLGSGTTSTLDPGTEGAGTLLVTASSITSDPASAVHTCTLADGTVAGQILTIVMVTTFLEGDSVPPDPSTGLLIIGPTNALNSSHGIVTITGEALGGNPQGATAVLMWTGSAWAILSTRRGGGTA